MAVFMPVNVFWGLAPYSPIDMHKRLRGTYRLRRQSKNRKVL
jgi:hypothetical protein